MTNKIFVLKLILFALICALILGCALFALAVVGDSYEFCLPLADHVRGHFDCICDAAPIIAKFQLKILLAYVGL